MSVKLVYEDNDGNMVEAVDRVREDTLELNLAAEEATTADSTIVIDNPDGDFYIRGLKPFYVIETEAETDERFGVIGIFYAWIRTWRRGPYRTGSSSEVELQCQDLNTLLTRRLQKGTDAERPQETDVTRMQWLVGTAEVIGGGGDNGFTIEDTDFLFTDSPVTVGETDYTGQDSAGVIDDVLQDGGKNAFLFPSPLEDELIRVGIWFGRGERTDYSTVHRISNYRTDINIDATSASFEMTAEDLIAGEWTFPPSIDSELERDPSRVYHGAMVNYDPKDGEGGYAYVTRPATAEQFARRDGLFNAELVKTLAQATRRATRYVRDLRNEDDAITTAVIVPSALVNAFQQGQRVQVRYSYMPGYSADFVWMRIARRTVRQLSGASLLYEIAMDLRADEPPDSEDTGSGGTSCIDVNGGPTPSQSWDPLGGSGPDTPNPSGGNVFYLNPGEQYPIVPTPGHVGHVHFPTYNGPGGPDTWGDCCQNCLRVLVVGDGTLTISTVNDGSAKTLYAQLQHHRYGDDGTGGVTVYDQTISGITPGDDIVVTVSTHDGANCTHWVDVKDTGAGSCGHGWGFAGATWVLDA